MTSTVDTANIKIGIGVDPEFFALDKEFMRLTSAHDLVPGSKDKPHPLINGAVQVDGLAIEYNTKPAYTAEEFVQYNKDVLRQIREMVPERYDFIYEPAVFFDKYYFESIPDSPKELGCSPDYNAFTGKMNPRPVPPEGKETMRTGSGHIHISWTEGADVDDLSHRFDCELVVQALETFVGPFFKKFDKDTDRSSLYGKPGAFRYKPYGVEWRSPSNAWLNHPEIWGWLFEVVTRTVRSLLEGKIIIKGDTINGRSYYGIGHLTKCRSVIGDFPTLPVITKAATSPKKSGSEFIFKRISPTSSKTTWDINLDIPENDSIPFPAYLEVERAVVHPNRGYGTNF